MARQCRKCCRGPFINEVLLKVLYHNLAVLIHEIHELGIDPNIGSEMVPEPQIIDLNQYRMEMGL